jgi:O-antigen/teichoic acid export membrane protein
VHLKKAIKIISIIIIPAIIVISLFGNYILLAFGKEYSYEGFILLKFLSLSGIFISISAIGSTILVIKHKIRLIIFLSLITTAVILSLSVIFIKMNLFGVVGVGIGWIVGQGAAALIYLFLIKRLL